MTSRERETGRTSSSTGVHVEEVPIGARPIESVGTAVAAFVGIAPKNPARAAAAVVAVVLVVWAVRSRRRR